MPLERQHQNQESALKALENLRKRLLDLTARNRLINFRHTKRGSLRIIDELPNQLAETLLAEAEMRFLPVPEPTRDELIAAGYIEIELETGQEVRLLKDPTAEEWAKRLGLSTAYEVPRPSTDELDDKHADNAIQTLFYPYELEARLKNLLRTAESAIQEMGANILYLAFGFLEWFDNSNDNARTAPLFLVPVRLHKGRLNPQRKTYEYTLSYSGEDIIPNLSLREKLRADFAMALPSLDENTKPEDYFNDVQALIQENQSRWRLRRFISVTLLNFSKLLMYLDLDPSLWPDGKSIVDHPVVTLFLAGYNAEEGEEQDVIGDFGFGEEYSIDEIDDVHTAYPLIDDADSSQHSALIDAIDGKNLVIEGPPGTGKSQTITNIIAAAMAKGKRVLFVAEKLAALEVVRRRLDKAGLGEFCLELHSHKSQKQKILDEIGNRLNKHGKYRRPRDIEVDIARYEELKSVLIEHVERISRPWKNTGRTLCEIFMAATRFREAIDINPDALHPEGYNGDSFDSVTQRRTADQVDAFRKVYQAVVEQLDAGSELKQHPWYGVSNADLQIFDLDQVKAALEEWQNALQNLGEEREKLAEELGCEQGKIADSLGGITSLLENLERVPSLKGDELLDCLPALRGEVLDQAQQYLTLFETIQSLYANLAERVGPDVLQDLSVVDGFLSGSEQLCKLVEPSVELGVLAEAIKQLSAIKDELDELDEPLKEIQSAVGEGAASYLLPTEAGFIEFGAFADLIADLNPSYWRLRDERLDNDELDDLLPKLRDELDQLRVLDDELQELLNFDGQVGRKQLLQIEESIYTGNYHQILIEKAAVLDEILPELREELEQLHALSVELQDVFNLDELTGAGELRQLGEILDAGGAFRWFKGSWRSARKQVLSHAVHNQIKISAVQPLLERAAEFTDLRDYFGENIAYKDALGNLLKGLDTNLNEVESIRDWCQRVGRKAGEFTDRKNHLSNNQQYKNVLGDYLKGLETDVVFLESLRDWYRRVRQQYGVGFGKKVVLGNAILGLSTEIARGVRSLSEQGVQQKLSNSLGELTRIKRIFMPVAELQSDRTLLTGKEGVIARTLASLDVALTACGSMMTNNTISISELANRIEMLDSLKKAVSKWEAADLDNKLFQGRLGLQPGLYTDNTSSISMLRDTLAVAACVDQQLTEQDVLHRIYDQPAESTFNELADLAKNLRTKMDMQASKYEVFAKLVKLEDSDWMGRPGDKLKELIIKNGRALSGGETLQNWLDYVRVRDQVAAMGLANLAKRVEQGDLNIQQVKDAHQAGVFDMLAREILREQTELGRFSGHSQEAIQEKFREYDNRLKKLQCEKIAWQIDQEDIPAGNYGARVSERTDLSLLEHECSKKKRHLPIRQLLRRASGALVATKPCFMMGPMSVAQYLVPGQIEFDLVIMDEASQIKPQDALGAVARGSQLVVVGDPKQLPPTSFFDRVVDDDEEDPTAIEESESILDATRPMFLARRLRWHYRSQHESLIAFSNHSFYESNLVLFPSPYKENENYGIQYSRVPRGCFVNRRNMEEARIVSDAVREHFKHRPNESLGVVAMNGEQRLQIESAIEALEKEDSAFQGWLEKDSRSEGPLFIKNLENVQGDERDVIFISMTYGPKEPGGKVFQRFGPINSDVGWRRLNVLFTRSKKRMHIFSSMGSEDIVADSVAKRGVCALRDFLSFCETGILHKTERVTERDPDSDFEIAVMEGLHNEGFECVPQVGVAGFFIDVAVVDPGNPGSYLMGIECDGATYHSAKTARDRDRLRQEILERLGWKIRRIWSTDWFKNPHAELQPIIRELKDLKTVRVENYQLTTESEVDEIEQIIEEVEEQEAVTERFLSEEIGLRERLVEFDREVVRRGLPNTPDNQRLLRPSMLDAMVEYTPTSKSQFLEFIPNYLRQSTEATEGQYLEQVLQIINASME
jgi:very-short-patch-repair endonuclease